MSIKKVRTIDVFIILVVGLALDLVLSEPLLDTYKDFNKAHGLITSFIKFAILATFGEVLGQRIRNNNYKLNQFGIFPKMVIWGFIGITIKLAFVIFATGTPQFMSSIGMIGIEEAMLKDISFLKIITALCISTTLNVIYAPVMMTFHKISDLHITSYQGKLISLVKPMKIGLLLKQVDWDIQWNFVFKKTIPLFWIPAHTVTFLLPLDYQVLFAALLSIALGMILAMATLKNK